MSIEKKLRIRGRMMTVGILGGLYSGLLLASYVPFPGKIEVKVVSIDTPSEITVSYETWPGFARNTAINLPGLEIPEDTPQADDCEREKAARALAFTRQFIDKAKKVFVKNMRMETSASEQAYSDIMTNQGSLSQALKTAGLARSDTVPPETSWCR